MTNCSCQHSADYFHCDRHQCWKTEHWHMLCRTREDYFQLWEHGVGPGQNLPEVVNSGTAPSLAKRTWNLATSLAAFMAEGLFDADEIVVDGTKIKASAGKGSYKRALRLDEAEAAAKGRVVALKAEVDADPAASSKRTQAARARGLQQVQERIEKARAKLTEIEAEKAKRSKRSPKEIAEKKETRVSLTDPEARRMRCASSASFAISYRGA